MRDPKLLCLPLAAISSNDSIVLLSEIDWHVLLGASFASQVDKEESTASGKSDIENTCQPPQKRNRRLSWSCRPGSATLASPKNVVDVIVPT